MTRRARPWWRTAVFYQVYPRSFFDSNGDGVGDLPGIIAKLDHLAGSDDSLGVDAVWLSPFYPSPMKDFGYDIADYVSVDPLFGSLGDIERLIRECHRRGLRVIVDLVPNHTSDQHPWFVESRSSPTAPRRDWYVWRRGTPTKPPNNWLSEFPAVGSAWTFDPHTESWYLHSFLREQPDLNWDNPQVEQAIHDVVRFWLRMGVDGFRVDVVYKIAKDPLLRDNPVPIAGPGVVPGGRHDEDWPTIRGRLSRLRHVLRSFGDRMMVGEVYLLDPHRIAAYIRTGRQLDLAHNFQFLNLPWRAAAFEEAVAEFEELCRPRGWPTWCLNNHDHPRVASRYPGEGAARVAGMMLLTLRGTPFLYQGEELGLLDGVVPPDAVMDIDGRDPERCPIPWLPPSQAGPAAGFSEHRPWLPVPPDAEAHNVATQAADPDSILSLYRRLIRLRKRTSALRQGTQRVLAAGTDVFAYVREGRRERLVVVLNFSDRPTTVDLGSAGSRGTVVCATTLALEGGDTGLAELPIAGMTGLVIRVAP